MRRLETRPPITSEVIGGLTRDATRVKASKKKQVTESREGGQSRQRRQMSSKDYGSGLLL